MDKLHRLFKNHKITITTKNSFEFETSWSLCHSRYIETDGAVICKHVEARKDLLTVKNFKYIMYIEEVNCEFVNCTIYINKKTKDEGMSLVEEILNKF